MDSNYIKCILKVKIMDSNYRKCILKVKIKILLIGNVC